MSRVHQEIKRSLHRITKAYFGCERRRIVSQQVSLLQVTRLGLCCIALLRWLFHDESPADSSVIADTLSPGSGTQLSWSNPRTVRGCATHRMRSSSDRRKH